MLIFLLRLCYTSNDTASEINKFVTKTLNILKRIHKEEPCTFDSQAFEITQNDDVGKITEVNNQCNKFIKSTNPYKIISKDSDIIYLLHSRILFLEKILKNKPNIESIKKNIQNLKSNLDSLKEKYDKIKSQKIQISTVQVIGKKTIKDICNIKKDIDFYNKTLGNFNCCIEELKNELETLQTVIKNDEGVFLLTDKTKKSQFEKFVTESPMKEKVENPSEILKIIDFIDQSKDTLLSINNVTSENALYTKEEDYKKFKNLSTQFSKYLEYYNTLQLKSEESYYNEFKNTLEYEILKLGDKLKTISETVNKKIYLIENQISEFKSKNNQNDLSATIESYDKNILKEIERIINKSLTEKANLERKKPYKSLKSGSLKETERKNKFFNNIKKATEMCHINFDSYFEKVIDFFEWFINKFDDFKTQRETLNLNDLQETINMLENYLEKNFELQFLERQIIHDGLRKPKIFQRKNYSKALGKKPKKENGGDNIQGYEIYYNDGYVIEFKNKIYASKYNDYACQKFREFNQNPISMACPNGSKINMVCFFN